MKCTPDFLRGVAVARVVGLMANAHEGGTWSLVDVTTWDNSSTLEFKVGVINADTKVDDRQTVRIIVTEES